MLQRLRNRQRGFTLIELLIVVAIIGIIAALLIPNFLDSLQKAKQKRTVADMRNIGTAMMAYVTDQAQGAAAGQTTAITSITMASYGNSMTGAQLANILVPQYVQDIPNSDGWKKQFTFWLKTGTQVLDRQVMAIVSGARDGNAPAGTYSSGSFDPTDYDQDIVWADGFFVRWPQGQGGAAATP